MDAGWIATLITWTVIFPLMLFIGRAWLQSIVQNAIKHEYDVMLENIKNANTKIIEEQKRQHEIRMKSALIAELMAEWVSPSDDKKKLRQLTNEAFLWLPAELAIELSRVLSHNPDALDYRTFMSSVRKYLQGEGDTLEPSHFIAFPLSQGEIRIVIGTQSADK